jgi:hypothetical protein
MKRVGPARPTCSYTCSMGDGVDWSKWRRTRLGYERVPPRTGPCGHRWAADGPERPIERSVTCTCTLARHHLTWVCPTCGTHCAEGCLNVELWASSTVPVDLPLDRRAAVCG